MNQGDLVNFLKDEISEMNRHKWIESEKVGFDLGQEALLDWIENYSHSFKKEWILKNSVQKCN